LHPKQGKDRQARTSTVHDPDRRIHKRLFFLIFIKVARILL